MLAMSMTKSPLSACLAEFSAKLGEERHEIGKAGGDHRNVVHCDGIARAEPEGEKGHGDTMIHVGLDQSAALDRAAALDDQSVAFDPGRDAASSKSGGGRAQAIAL